MATKPQNFNCPYERDPELPAFKIAGTEYETNPKYLLTNRDWLMIRLWKLHQGGGLGGVGFLPEAGGTMNQPMLMIECFALMDDHHAILMAKKGK